jgi:hypothetical protein
MRRASASWLHRGWLHHGSLGFLFGVSRISVAFTPPISRFQKHPHFCATESNARDSHEAQKSRWRRHKTPLFSAAFASHRLKFARIAALFARVV